MGDMELEDSVIIINRSIETIDLSSESDHEETTQEGLPNSRDRQSKNTSKPRISIVDLSNDTNISISNEIDPSKNRFSCPICFNPWQTDGVTATTCGHVFCTNCIKTLVKSRKTCPICMKPLQDTDLIKLYL